MDSKRELDESLTKIARIVAEATGFDGDVSVRIDISDPHEWVIEATFGESERKFYARTLAEVQEAVESMVEWMLSVAGGGLPAAVVYGRIAQA